MSEPTDVAWLLQQSGVVAFGKKTTWDTVSAALSGLRASLNGISPGERALLVEAVKFHVAKVERIQSPAEVARGFLTTDAAKETALQGRTLELPDPDPWPHPVDGAAVLLEVVQQCQRYLFLPRGAPETLALWAAHTHAFAAATASPLLVLLSPEKRCGKTTTLRFLDALVRRPVPTTSISAAALFRAVERWHPTLLIDEADASLKHEELYALLCGGHTPDSAFAVRTVGDEHEVRLFTTWCPKALAKIGKLDGVLEDRSITLHLERKSKGEVRERLRHDRRSHLHDLRRKIARFAADNMERLVTADPEIPEDLNDRAADNWRPLFAIADCLNDVWAKRIRETALGLASVTDEAGGSKGVQLLADLSELFRNIGEDNVASKRICDALNEREDRPWSGWSHGRGLEPRTLADSLRKFGIGPHDVRTNDGIKKGYRRQDFADAWARYLPGGGSLQEASP